MYVTLKYQTYVQVSKNYNNSLSFRDHSMLIIFLVIQGSQHFDHK
jgi:hypothetical protein